MLKRIKTTKHQSRGSSWKTCQASSTRAMTESDLRHRKWRIPRVPYLFLFFFWWWLIPSTRRACGVSWWRDASFGTWTLIKSVLSPAKNKISLLGTPHGDSWVKVWYMMHPSWQGQYKILVIKARKRTLLPIIKQTVNPWTSGEICQSQHPD